MHEDVEIERSAFAPGGRIFCIASAGSTAMALSAEHEVVAVDINPVQIAYLERRLAGRANERGSAERFLAFLRSFAPLVGWTRRRREEFLALAQPNEQIAYWRAHLDTRRLRSALNLLLAPTTLRIVYAQALLDALPRNFGSVMRGRMERGFARHPNRTNPYARMLLLGEPVPDPALIRAERIRLSCADAAAFLEGQPPRSFNGFSISNILDGTNSAYAERLFEAIRHAAAPGAMVVWRSFREPASTLMDNRAADDRSMLWGLVAVRAATELRRLAA